MYKEPLLHTYFKTSNFIFWSIYLLSHVLISPPHTSDISCYHWCPCAQFPFVPVGPPHFNGGLPWLEIVAEPARWIDLRVSSLRPWFPPFIIGASLYPGCSHFFTASLCPVLPVSMSACSVTARSDRSGVGGPSEQTPSVDQQTDSCAGYGICWCRIWGPDYYWILVLEECQGLLQFR